MYERSTDVWANIVLCRLECACALPAVKHVIINLVVLTLGQVIRFQNILLDSLILT